MDNKKNNELITEYGNFAYGIANLYRNKGLDWEDLKQEAILGLLKAGEHYDPIKCAIHYLCNLLIKNKYWLR